MFFLCNIFDFSFCVGFIGNKTTILLVFREEKIIESAFFLNCQQFDVATGDFKCT